MFRTKSAKKLENAKSKKIGDKIKMLDVTIKDTTRRDYYRLATIEHLYTVIESEKDFFSLIKQH